MFPRFEPAGLPRLAAVLALAVAFAAQLDAAERRGARDGAQLGLADGAERAQLFGLLPDLGLVGDDIASGY